MKEILVTLEQGADASLINKILENIKGILRTSIRDAAEDRVLEDTETAEWIRKMKALSRSVDAGQVDLEDERTRYIMSK